MNANNFRLMNWTDSMEAGACLRLNRITRHRGLKLYFTAISRLGNGVLWYSILAAIPLLGGVNLIPLTLHIGSTALIGVAIYKFCKLTLVRERPFVTHEQIVCIGTPLDRGSFPSGHTIHATSFTIMLGTLYPPALWVLVPVAGSIAISRIVLGHHYPSDVLAGAVIGTYLGATSLSLLPATMFQT